MFCALSQNYQHFMKNNTKVYTSYIQETQGTQKITLKKKKKPSGSLVIDQHNILTVLIYTLKTAWPIKISMSV